MSEHEARKSANHRPGTLRRLTCACCGEPAGRWAQWFNQDTGYGICLRCVTWFRQDIMKNGERRQSEEEIKSYYGIEGQNWGARIKVYERTYRAVACFVDTQAGQDKANAWMRENPTHGLIATQDGYHWLADVNDKGEVQT